MLARRAAALFLILGAFGACQNPGRRNGSLTIGVIFPLTGPIAQYGTYMKQGVELALDDAVREGLVGKDEVRLVVEDSEASPAKSVLAFQKIVNTSRPVAVIPASSGPILGLKPIANREQIVLVNASAVSTEIEDADDYVFSVIPNASIEGVFLADFAFKSGKKKAGVLYRNDASGKSFAEVFRSRFQELGGRIVYEDAHAPEETDYHPYITAIANTKEMDVLFIPSFGPEVATYLKQASELGVRVQAITYTTFNSPKSLEIAGQAAEGILFSAPVFESETDSAVSKELREKVASRYGQQEINYYIASHYDAMMLLLTAISKGHKDGSAIRDYLAELPSYQGKSGIITFGRNGSANMPLRIYTVAGGRIVPDDGR